MHSNANETLSLVFHSSIGFLGGEFLRLYSPPSPPVTGAGTVTVRIRLASSAVVSAKTPDLDKSGIDYLVKKIHATIDSTSMGSNGAFESRSLRGQQMMMIDLR